jgi:hypothetical protein
MLRVVIFCGLALSAGCIGSVDRTPPRRDVGLPSVPPPPLELAQVPALPSASLAADDPVWAPPPGCALAASQAAGTMRSYRCKERLELTPPSGWIGVDGAAVWRREGIEVGWTWSRTGDLHELVLSAHVVKPQNAR